MQNKTPKFKIDYNIKYFREIKGHTLRSLSDLTNIDKSRLQRLECGKSHPYYWEVVIISYILEIPISKLVRIKKLD